MLSWWETQLRQEGTAAIAFSPDLEIFFWASPQFSKEWTALYPLEDEITHSRDTENVVSP